MTDGANAPDPAPAPDPKPAPAPEPKPAGDGTTEKPALTNLHLLGLVVVIVGILAVLAIVMPKFSETKETVTGVLGIVIPAFATIGAAIFGVTVGYSQGTKSGEATGKAEGEENKADAVAGAKTAGRKGAARELLARLEPSETATRKVVGGLETMLVSPANDSRFLLRPEPVQGEPAAFSSDDLASARSGISEAVRRCREILAE